MLRIYTASRTGHLVAGVHTIPIVLVEAAVMLKHKDKGLELIKSQGLDDEEAEALYQAGLDSMSGQLRNYAVEGDPFAKGKSVYLTDLVASSENAGSVWTLPEGEVLTVPEGTEAEAADTMNRIFKAWKADIAPMLTEAYKEGLAAGKKTHD